MQLSGYKIFVQPASKVYHVGGGTLPAGKQKTYLNFRNNLVMLTKNFRPGEKLWKIPARMILDNVAAWQGLLSGKRVVFGAIYKAHFYYIKWLFATRNKIKIEKNSKTMAGVYDGSIIWQYFVKKKKTFSEIVKRK
jgi:hypothetical protein